MWFEKWFGNWSLYGGRIDTFKIGLNIGLENELYLGFWMIGIGKEV